MATLPPVTDTIARFVTETDLSAVSAKTRVNATMHILDVLGVALAGVSTPPAEIALDYCKRLGVATEASIWGTHVKASVSTAAFANGLLAHALDFDDWDAFIHVGHPTSMLDRRSAAAGGKNRRVGQGSSQSLRAWHRSDL